MYEKNLSMYYRPLCSSREIFLGGMLRSGLVGPVSIQYSGYSGGSSGVVVILNASLMERCSVLLSSLLSAHQTFSKYRFWLLRGVTNRELPSGEMSIVSKQDVSDLQRNTGCPSIITMYWLHEQVFSLINNC